MIPPNVFADKPQCDAILDKLFNAIINVGITSYSMAARYDQTLTATNFLKRDRNYYGILSDHWPSLQNEIVQILGNVV